LIRAGGYNSFSLEEVATELEIELEEIHKHFKTKGDLALAVAIRYTFKFLTALGEPSPSTSTPKEQLGRYCEVFETAFETSGHACLCGVLSKEVESLPEKVKNAVIDFVNANIDWLTQALSGHANLKSQEELKESAQWIYCSLQGAMTVSALTMDKSWIKSASKSAISHFFETSAH
jgi:TetR/AcrR family transcriptional repressor of nem operon